MRILKVGCFVFVFIITIIATFVGGAIYCAHYILTPVGGQNSIKMHIAEGTSASEVAMELERGRIVRNSLLFKLLLKTTGTDKAIKPGDYVFTQKQTMMEILHILKTGNMTQRLVTIPEGLTISQMAELLQEKGIVRKEDFLAAVKNGDFLVNGGKRKTLEGFLLPDTYDFPPNYTASDIIKKMIREFENRVVPAYIEKQKSLPINLTLDEVVIMASLVEREAKIPDERPIIASVYYNRLKKGMLLQCDATIQYALGENKPVLTYDDLKIDSPYNTYIHKGLPPTAIANPGINSIKAVLAPRKTNYLFYVRNDVKNDGSHVFTSTLEEHNEAIRKYQR